jgi:hypothetical protein
LFNLSFTRRRIHLGAQKIFESGSACTLPTLLRFNQLPSPASLGSLQAVRDLKMLKAPYFGQI